MVGLTSGRAGESRGVFRGGVGVEAARGAGVIGRVSFPGSRRGSDLRRHELRRDLDPGGWIGRPLQALEQLADRPAAYLFAADVDARGTRVQAGQAFGLVVTRDDRDVSVGLEPALEQYRVNLA